MDYLIIVNDNGELKKISAAEFGVAFPLQTQQIEAMLNSILDDQSKREAELTYDDQIEMGFDAVDEARS